jgi:predicted DNA-binding mobile mystery protein A
MGKGSRKRDRRILDTRFKAMPPSSTWRVPKDGWIRSIRQSLGMSAMDLGNRLGIARQSILALEKSELEGRIQIDSLKKVAEAMDCTLVYALVPKSSLEDFVQKQIQKIAKENLIKVSHSMKLEDQEVGFNESLYDDFLKEFEDSSRLWRSDARKIAK